ncbi:MAG: DUF126 domain-containing protein [Burkholderiales bacterium]|nr:DUF126 domain-containing protein [Burkholderiales bacterium]
MPADAPILSMHGPPGIGPVVEGEVLVSQHGFNARYDLDRETGCFSRPEHDLFGRSCPGRILVFGGAKGGIATSWALHDLAARGMAPLGLVFRRANPVVAQGCALAGVALIDRLDADPVLALSTGDVVRLVPEQGRLELVRRGGARP